ncbi:hypothetical protein BJ322DRAFT_1111171 [Thelephora terrestris]|uniref:DUF6818 domain-containing protein n=1 Tax=Thelephora terrestris TaxID=56493 RepID=A0A9P6H9N5_9AGAM|nr:hypothetical protein BJ322DRAFT_1111171 [Thelephora terrestris]
MATLASGRQFYVDHFTAQTFYREAENGDWIPLQPSDYHAPRPDAHNALTRAPNDPGLSSVNPALSVPSHLCMDTATQPPPATQGYSDASQFSYEYRQPIAQPLPSVHNRSLPAPMPQNPAQPERNARRTRRSTRAHDPVRGQRTARQREGGRGRTRGAPNYKPREVKVLLDLVEEELPIASKGWRVIGSQFRDWAVVTEYPARTNRSLELKYKQLVRTRKPTGDAECPPEILRAHEIDHKIQSKVACRDLEDGEIADFEDGNFLDNSDDNMSDSYDPPEDSDEGPAPNSNPAPRVRTTRVKSPLLSQESTRQSSSKGTNVLEKISQSFDPEVQSRREADRASSMFQSHQLILLQSQIRDLNSTVLSLRGQLDDAERRCVNADRRADRLQNQIDITSAVTRARLHRSTARVPRLASPITISSSPESTPEYNRRYEATFRDGSRCSWFGNINRLDPDDNVVEVTRVPWSPPPHSPAQSPPQSPSLSALYHTDCEV